MNGRKMVDLFCGAGGTSTGFVNACKKRNLPYHLTVVNHWTVAIKTHKANHPEAAHICTPLEDVCPSEAVAGPIDHLHASPECIHHSKAAGGRPRNPQSRATAMWVIHWARVKKPKWITVENVVEFMDWGPLNKQGRPIKALKGIHFKRWVRCLESLGYRCEWRVLNAADYSDPTSRKRFIMVARLGKGEIPWPKRSFVSRKEKTKGVDAHLPTWRPIRDCIDWGDLGESIFTRRKPLAEKTIQRIIKGLEKYGGEAAEPFLLVLRNHVDCQGIDEPIGTLVGSGTHFGIVEPFIVRYHKGNCIPVSESLPTITGTECFAVVDPFLVQYHAGDGREARVSDINDPVNTLDTSNRYGFVSAVQLLLPHQKFEIDGCDDINEPHRTIDATNARCNRVAQAFLVDLNHGVDANMTPGSSASRRSHDIEDPIQTLTTQHGKALVSPFIVPQFGEREGQAPRTHSLFDPAPAVTGHGAGALVCPIIVETPEGRFGLDIRLRMLKISELAAATGFPKDYKFFGTNTDITRQIGNAVPVGLSEAIAGAIIDQEEAESALLVAA